MFNKIFSDSFAQKKNYLTEIDARVKLFFTAAAMVITILSRHFCVPLIALFLSLVFLLHIRVPLKIIFLRLAGLLGMAWVALIIQVFFYGITPIVKLNIWGFHILGYKEGLLRGSLIMAKVLGTGSLVIFLSMTTPINKLLNTARWLKVPDTLLEIIMFSYRYIFVLLEDAVTIMDAQKVRLGYRTVSISLRSLGDLAGSAVIRAYDQSLAVYEAMVLRGYKGKMFNAASCREKFKRGDILASFVFITILSVLLVLNIQ